MKTDLRNPQALGEAYLFARKMGRSIEDSVNIPVVHSRHNEGPVEKYGKPGDHEAKWERIQVK